MTPFTPARLNFHHTNLFHHHLGLPDTQPVAASISSASPAGRNTDCPLGARSATTHAAQIDKARRVQDRRLGRERGGAVRGGLSRQLRDHSVLALWRGTQPPRLALPGEHSTGSATSLDLAAQVISGSARCTDRAVDLVSSLGAALFGLACRVREIDLGLSADVRLPAHPRDHVVAASSTALSAQEVCDRRGDAKYQQD
jgi:hypothetical protein